MYHAAGRTILALLSCVILGWLSPNQAQAFILDKLGDKNFVDFLNGSASQWSCIINNDNTLEQDFCSAGQHYQAAYDKGITFGSAGLRTTVLQQSNYLDNTDQYPIVALTFDYQLTSDTGGADFSVILVPPSGGESVTLLSEPVTSTTGWQHATFDLHYYAAGTPTIEFVMTNSSADAATVSLRKVHLVVKSHATLQANFVTSDGEAITSGRLKIKTPRGRVTNRQQVDDDGSIAILFIDGRVTPQRLELNYHGKRYMIKHRFRYGWDYVDEFKLNSRTERLVANSHEHYY